MTRAFCRAALAGAALLSCASAASVSAEGLAPDVALTLRDGAGGGAMVVSGRLRAFDGEFATLDTIYGELTVAVEDAACDGPGCAVFASYLPRLTLAGVGMVRDDGTVDGVAFALVRAFAESRGLAPVAVARDGGAMFALNEAATGTVVAEVLFRPGPGAPALVALLNGEADIVISHEVWRDPVVRSDVLALDAVVPVSTRAEIVAATLDALLAGAAGPLLAAVGEDAALAMAARHPSADLQPTAGDPQALRATLGADRDRLALGLRSDAGLADLARPVAGDCLLRLQADPDGLRTEDWPLTLPLLAYRRAQRPAPLLRDLLAFLPTPEAAAVVRAAGLVDPGLTLLPLAGQGERLAQGIAAAGPDVSLGELQDIVRTFDGADRLSATFRFEPGSATLDPLSEGSLRRLAAEIAAGRFAGRRLILGGFSDSVGAAAANRRLSLERAEAVRDALADALPGGLPADVALEVHGFGEALPVACDDSELGRQSNRRVEVWLR